MTGKKWTRIVVDYDDGMFVQIHRSDFDKLESVSPILEVLLNVKRMQSDINRLLGEAEG